MRSVIGGLMLLILPALVLAGDDDRDRRAKAAFAFTESQTKAVTGKCGCEPGTRGEWGAQLPKALTEGRVIVLFSNGVEPRCCKGTLIGTLKDLPAGQDKGKPIIVYSPVAQGRLLVVAELPADASNAQLTAAVRKANGLLPEKPK
jgi:hypothetical protein